jgi:hypothetical protein
MFAHERLDDSLKSRTLLTMVHPIMHHPHFGSKASAGYIDTHPRSSQARLARMVHQHSSGCIKPAASLVVVVVVAAAAAAAACIVRHHAARRSPTSRVQGECETGNEQAAGEQTSERVSFVLTM